MIAHDHKQAMQSIMSKRQGLDGDVASAPLKQEVVTTEDGHMDGRHAAAADALAAIHEKSPMKLMDALAAFHDMHSLHSAKQKSEESQESQRELPY